MLTESFGLEAKPSSLDCHCSAGFHQKRGKNPNIRGGKKKYVCAPGITFYFQRGANLPLIKGKRAGLLAVPELSLLIAHGGLGGRKSGGIVCHWGPSCGWMCFWFGAGLGGGGAAGSVLLHRTITAHLPASVAFPPCLYLRQRGVWGLLGIHPVKERGLAGKLQPKSPECQKSF